MEYRYMIYNDLMKEYQFANICETTEKGANTLLFKIIGQDANKHRFRIVKLEKENAIIIRQEIKDRNKVRRLHQELPNINYEILYSLVKENRKNEFTRITKTNNR